MIPGPSLLGFLRSAFIGDFRLCLLHSVTLIFRIFFLLALSYALPPPHALSLSHLESSAEQPVTLCSTTRSFALRASPLICRSGHMITFVHVQC
jgi:hypothetical protein